MTALDAANYKALYAVTMLVFQTAPTKFVLRRDCYEYTGTKDHRPSWLLGQINKNRRR